MPVAVADDHRAIAVLGQTDLVAMGPAAPEGAVRGVLGVVGAGEGQTQAQPRQGQVGVLVVVIAGGGVDRFGGLAGGVRGAAAGAEGGGRGRDKRQSLSASHQPNLGDVCPWRSPRHSRRKSTMPGIDGAHAPGEEDQYQEEGVFGNQARVDGGAVAAVIDDGAQFLYRSAGASPRRRTDRPGSRRRRTWRCRSGPGLGSCWNCRSLPRLSPGPNSPRSRHWWPGPGCTRYRSSPCPAGRRRRS